MSFETTIHVLSKNLPAEFVRFVEAQYPDEPALRPDDEIPDLAVEIDYIPGYTPARVSGRPEDSEPDDGEMPEIVSATLYHEGYAPVDLLPLLPDETVRVLEARSWKHQQDAAQDYDGGA